MKSRIRFLSIGVLGLATLGIVVDLLWPRTLPSMSEQRSSKWSDLWAELHQREPSWKQWSYRADLYRKVMVMSSLKPGHYPFESPVSTLTWLRTLNTGRQTPVRLVLGKFRTKAQFASFLSRKLRSDSTQWIQMLIDSFRYDSVSMGPELQMALYLPNSYELYWTVEPKAFQSRMLKEFKVFWTPRRMAQADRVGLHPFEVITLASIIEEETQHKPERPVVAGVYLNRLRMGMPLQADPTLKFAAEDFVLRRIGKNQIAISSPYNTYKVKGLPPGPICTPSADAIDAVLRGQTHSFLYFCADPTQPGTHRFAATWSQHQQNAMVYHRWLNRRGIR
ncbi:MAG: endolytic transglycosylase MltG [Sphingomonadales bacterium]|nr:endolytic transglycosylase MltG [Sphingomonadales bacterium]MBM3923493.1 endolytic transglycosylase MltG [Sphingomonadales bacterium]